MSLASRELLSVPRNLFLRFVSTEESRTLHAVRLRHGLQLLRTPGLSRDLSSGSVWHTEPVTAQQQASAADRAGAIYAPTFMRASAMVGTEAEPVRWWVDVENHVLCLSLQ